MEHHRIHEGHEHAHGPGCGHTGVYHGDHVDYLHDGHVDEHAVEVGDANPDRCTPDHDCGGHGAEHEHGRGAATRRSPMGTTSTFLSEVISTIRTVTTSAIMEGCGLREAARLPKPNRRS